MFKLSCLESEVIVGNVVDSGLSQFFTESYAKSKKVILVDENTNQECLPHLFTHIDGLSEAEIIELPPGEENKSMEMCFSVWEALSEMEIGRGDLLICLGGGMICDMGGFIASIFKRGMNCIYIPTSLLSMVDASVGGKTGVDLGSLKNQLGTFSCPSHVFIDTTFLSTLPEKEKENGLAEMLKHGLIADADHFNALSEIITSDITDQQIFDSIQIKTKIVEEDPTEKGVRKLLNFGHTIGHSIEGTLLGSENQMDHGLAVAHGMLVEAKISALNGTLKEPEFLKIEKVLRNRFSLSMFTQEEIIAFVELTRHDKKRIEGSSRITLLQAIGEGVYDVEISDEMILEAFQVLT